MKQFLKHDNLPWLTLLCGGIGLLLRTWLLSTENDKGFITPGHISEILLTLLTLGFLAVLFWACRDLKQANKYSFNFPADPVAAIGSVLAFLGCGIAAAVELTVATDLLETFCAPFGLVAAAAFAYAGYCRWKGLHTSLLFHVAICIWLTLRLICLYRSWSSDPQLEDYCYQLLAIVCAMLTAYHRAAFAAELGQRTWHAFFSLAGVYCCALSLAGPDGVVLYLSLGTWMFTDLCRLNPMPRQVRRSSV